MCSCVSILWEEKRETPLGPDRLKVLLNSTEVDLSGEAKTRIVLRVNMLPKSRLGKRSTMGALVCGSSCHAADGQREVPQGEPESYATSAGSVGLGPRSHGVIRVKLHPGQKVSRKGDICSRPKRVRVYVVYSGDI